MIKLLNNSYEIVKGKENFIEEETKYLFTEFFSAFDYILGDYSCGKLRLKGFYNSNNKSVKAINDIKILDGYISNYCAPGSKTFLIKKLKNK